MNQPSERRVLIADDDPQARELIHHILENAGCEVIGEAEDGEQVVELAEEHQPDVILLDLTMPKMDGLEALRYLRQQDSEVPIIVVSAHEDPDLLLESIRSGANGYLTKMQLASHLGGSISAVMTGEFAVADPNLLQEAFVGGKKRGNQTEGDFVPSELLQNLTPREKSVLSLIAQGYDNHGIADELVISYNTVKAHTNRIFNKLEVDNRTQAALIALNCDLVDSE